MIDCFLENIFRERQGQVGLGSAEEWAQVRARQNNFANGFQERFKK